MMKFGFYLKGLGLFPLVLKEVLVLMIVERNDGILISDIHCYQIPQLRA